MLSSLVIKLKSFLEFFGPQGMYDIGANRRLHYSEMG